MFDEYNEIMDVKDIQSALNIGRSLAYKLISAGELRCIKVGNRIRVPKKFLEEFVSNSNQVLK